MAKIKTDSNSMGLPMNIKRSEPIPLDASELYYTKAEAEAYAATGATAYVGQTLKVIEEGTVNVYVIGDTSGTLIQLADTAAVDAVVSTLEIDYQNNLAFDKNITILLPRQELKFVPEEDADGNVVEYRHTSELLDFDDPSPIDKIMLEDFGIKDIDDTFIIEWDGVPYTVKVAKDPMHSFFGETYLGNASYLNSQATDTGEPFVFVNDWLFTKYFITKDPAQSHTIQISRSL